MSQSTILIGSLVAMFLVYLAAKGRLPAYLAVFTAAAPSGSGSGGSVGTGTDGTKGNAPPIGTITGLIQGAYDGDPLEAGQALLQSI